jgi:hypothetical protein
MIRIIAGAGSAGVSKFGNLTIAPAAALDLTDSKLVTTSPIGAWNGSNYDGVTGLIKSGRNSGAWNGSGIITSMTAASSAGSLTTLAVSVADDAGYGGTKTFGGQSVSPSDVLVMYTYAGDADLSGSITGDDYFRIDAGYATRNTATPLLGYANGDFDYNGAINADDYFLIDRNYARQGASFSAAAPLGGGAVVPEPAIGGLFAVALLTGRRRRR